MGPCSPTICSSQGLEHEATRKSYSYEYGEDVREPVIEHKDEIVIRAAECERTIKECQDSLKDTGRLYKDPLVNTEPLILRSLTTQNSELRCTFERPHVFLNDPSDPTRGKSRIYKIVDSGDCSSSQITIRDEVMQPFGVLLCFLAEHPQLITQIILTNPNSYGICVLRMNIEAKKEYVYIDDYILCSDQRPLFSQPIRGIYMWPCLLEKAWLKVKGYINQKIEKNSPIDIFKSFLSHPISTYDLVEGNQSFNRLLLADYLLNQDSDKGYVITSKVAPPHKIGLSGRKHFYLLKVVKYEQKTLFYMRNPCSTFDFRGSYRILSEELEKQLKTETEQVQIHEGNFVLEESEFIEQIDSFSIIEFNKNSQQIIEESISLAVNEETFMLMDLKSDSLVSISFSQHNYRDNDLYFLPLSFLAVSLKDNAFLSEGVHEGPTFGVETAIFFPKVYRQLKAGQYLIRLKKRLYDLKHVKKYDKPDKIIVTAQSKVKFDYKQIGLLDRHFRTFLLETGRAELRQKMSQSKDLTNSGVEYIDFWLGDLAVIYFEKTSKSKREVRVEVKFMKIENLECISHLIGSDYKALDPISENEVMIFQKKVLQEAAKLGQFILDTY